MPTAINKRPTKTDQAIRRLYITVDRVIQAADEARRARDELIRLAKLRSCTQEGSRIIRTARAVSRRRGPAYLNGGERLLIMATAKQPVTAGQHGTGLVPIELPGDGRRGAGQR